MAAEIAWAQQSEDTDNDGFFLEGEAAFRADMRDFAEWGAPDTESAVFVSHEVEDRDEATITAVVSDALAEWLREKGLCYD